MTHRWNTCWVVIAGYLCIRFHESCPSTARTYRPLICSPSDCNSLFMWLLLHLLLLLQHLRKSATTWCNASSDSWSFLEVHIACCPWTIRPYIYWQKIRPIPFARTLSLCSPRCSAKQFCCRTVPFKVMESMSSPLSINVGSSYFLASSYNSSKDIALRHSCSISFEFNARFLRITYTPASFIRLDYVTRIVSHFWKTVILKTL